MKYNGKELVEMTAENWDGKSREMFAWCDDPKPLKVYICGYNPLRNFWICAESSIGFRHCAEIPKEEKVETIEESALKTKELQKEIEKLKEENEKLKMGVELKLLKNRRMTYKELDEWLTQHKGVARIGRNILKKIVYDQVECDKEVSSSLEICGYDEYTWHKPTVEVFTRILRG